MADRFLTLLSDLLLLSLSAVILFVLATGGGVLIIAGTRVSVTSVGNPLTLLLAVGILRWSMARHRPFLGIASLSVDTLDERAARLCRRVTHALRDITEKRAFWLVSAAAAASFVVRLANAYFYYGFFAGDDVEIHEMTLATLFGYEWDVWNLRSPFFPMTFIFPLQWILSQVGLSETGLLVFAGRAVVATFSSLTLIFLFVIGRRAIGTPSALLAVAFLAASALHARLGSTELPRPVAAFFLVIAFGFMLTEGIRASVLTGFALAIAAAMRFSEAVFLLPCVAGLLTMRRWCDAFVTTVTFLTAWLFVLGIADWLYWGSPFFSLQNAVDYTLVKGLSSRGYEPFHHYMSHIPEWSDFLTVALGLMAFRFRIWLPALWAWIPVVVLSLLAHKEARYLVPVLPFLALASGAALWRVLQDVNAESVGRRRIALALVVAVCAAAVFQLSGFRFERSERSVDLAVSHRAEWTRDGVAVEQLWRVGGRLYLPDARTVLDIAPERLTEPNYLGTFAADPAMNWIVLRRQSLSPEHIDILRAAGHREIEAQHSRYRVFRRAQPALGISHRGKVPLRPNLA